MKIKVITAPGCIKCHDLIGMLDAMSVQFQTIDITRHPKYLKKYMIMTAPALIIDGRLAYTGVPNHRRLKRLLAEQGSSRKNSE